MGDASFYAARFPLIQILQLKSFALPAFVHVSLRVLQIVLNIRLDYHFPSILPVHNPLKFLPFLFVVKKYTPIVAPCRQIVGRVSTIPLDLRLWQWV